MRGTDAVLAGVDGRTPLGFLMALGAQTAFAASELPTLCWEMPTARPILDGCTVDEIVERVVESFQELMASPAASGDLVTDDLKFATTVEARNYLEAARSGGGLAAAFAAAQVSEGAVASDGRAKPSALHFTSGQMKFLGIARALASGPDAAGTKTNYPRLSASCVRDALVSPGNGLTLLRWGSTDGRTHALCAASPAERTEMKRTKAITNPAPTVLALLGMSRFPTWTSDRNRSVTRGFFGRWPHTFVWPLWEQPAGWRTVGGFLAQVRPDPDDDATERYAAWGITSLWAAPVLRSGRYLSFGATTPVWQAG